MVEWIGDRCNVAKCVIGVSRCESQRVTAGHVAPWTDRARNAAKHVVDKSSLVAGRVGASGTVAVLVVGIFPDLACRICHLSDVAWVARVIRVADHGRLRRSDQWRG